MAKLKIGKKSSGRELGKLSVGNIGGVWRSVGIILAKENGEEVTLLSDESGSGRRKERSGRGN